MPSLKESTAKKLKTIALAGNPNSGKTTIFNALTGLRQKTANYPGITVEKKEGFFTLPSSKETVSTLDLPGAYSLLTRSLDEDVVHDVLLGRQAGTVRPDLVLIIADAGNLQRNLFFVTQILETGIPAILVLNMWDVVAKQSIEIDLARLSEMLQVRVTTTIGSSRKGIQELKALVEEELKKSDLPRGAGFKLKLKTAVEEEISRIQREYDPEAKEQNTALRGEILRWLGDIECRSPILKTGGAALKESIAAARSRLFEKGIDMQSFEAEARYDFIQDLSAQITRRPLDAKASLSEKLDAVLTHKIGGFLIFFALMALVFQSIFSWASAPMEMLDAIVTNLGGWLGEKFPDGQLKSLIVDGVVAGVGGVVIFLPQILFLFFFIALFEDSGYMARAAFVLDRLMRKVGLNGKSFIPLLSSFACAVPAIMSARTIEDRNDRFATIMVAPLMSCSARLPVYTLMIAAFIPSTKVAGIFDLKGVTLFSMYVLSIVSGLSVAAIFRKTLLKGNKTPFVLELPPYRIPNMRTVMITMLERAKQFLYRAGTIIFMLSIVLWFLASYPRSPATQDIYISEQPETVRMSSADAAEEADTEAENRLASEQLRNSYAGRLGRLIEPVIRPLGFDWKIGIGLVASFAAREVFVSTLAIVYSVREGADSDTDLISRLRSEVSPETGAPVYSPLVALSLMVFYVLACQCISTIAIVKRETNSWRWPVFMVFYMTVLAWCGSFVVFQTGSYLISLFNSGV